MPLDFNPDGSRFLPGVLSGITAWVPTVNDTYRVAPPPKLEAYSAPHSSNDILGSAIVKNASGTALLYAGSATKILQANGTTGWNDRSGTTYSATGWSFAQFSDTTIAASGGDKLQKATGGSFSDLSSDAPSAKIVVVHENAAVAFNTSSAPDGWYRSDTGDVTNWTASGANDADSGVLRGGVGGPVVAATVFGPLCIAWKANAMYSGIITGGTGGAADPKIRWDFVPGGVGIGCVGQHAHIETDIGVIFVSPRDIMLFDGGRPRSIAGKVRNWFLSQVVSKSNVFLTHNEVERNVYIWYPPSGNTYPTRALVFNYQTGKWGQVSSVSNNSDGANSYARCGVRGANITDYQAVGGLAGGGISNCNPVFVTPAAGTGARLANFGNGTGALPKVQPEMVTGYYGKPDQDSTFYRILQAPGNSAPPKLGSGTNEILVTPIDSMLNGGTSVAGAPDALGHADIAVQSRYLAADLTWTLPLVDTGEIRDLIVQSRPAGTR